MLIAVVVLSACFWGMWISLRLGFARLLVEYGMTVGTLAAADAAIKLEPSDAEAAFARASLLKLSAQTDRSLAEFERAVALRPRDYYLWLELGLVRDEVGDTQGALSSFNEAVRLASHYAQPRWQRGNFFLRNGRYDEAFADLRQAAESNPALLPNLIDLAWGLSKGDARLAEQLIQPRTDKERATFARYLARKGNSKEALAQFRAAELTPDENTRDIVKQLISRNAFNEAYEIWRRDKIASADGTPPSVYDGGFEGSLSVEESGFGWRVFRTLTGVKLSVDSSQRHSGSRSFVVEFLGDSNPTAPLISQLAIVEQSTRYRIRFAAKTKDMVTGGLPLVIVTDATGAGKRLGQSTPVRQDVNNWKVFSYDFSTEPSTQAVTLSLQRESCTTSPCPIFGFLWLDSFSLEALK